MGLRHGGGSRLSGRCTRAREKMKREIESVDAYIAAQPEAAQAALDRVRRTIQKAVPKAEETISYKIPTYKLDGERMLYFAGWKQHYSLYPATKRLAAALKEDLKPYEVVKSTVRFSLEEPVPVKLIAKIAKFRAKEVSESEKS
jgi:uncharacterized protein YdhG (YjbR/CyaY superfamily)